MRVVAALILLALALPVPAAPAPAGKPPRGHDALAESVEIYKAGLERMLPIYEADLQRRTELLNQAAARHVRGELPASEVERARRLVASTREQIADTRREMHMADLLVVESRARWQLVELGRAVPGAYQVGKTVIRYIGTRPWALADIGSVEKFYLSRFSRALPISALGQTALHRRMGLDHRESVDVAVHPDSREGVALLSYLRARRIPFIAYRGAVAGAATGAHVHIGLPSDRLESEVAPGTGSARR